MILNIRYEKLLDIAAVSPKVLLYFSSLSEEMFITDNGESKI